MPATTSGAKTCLVSVSPALTGTVLTSLLAIAVENLTVAQLNQIHDAINRVSGGGASGATIGSLLS